MKKSVWITVMKWWVIKKQELKVLQFFSSSELLRSNSYNEEKGVQDIISKKKVNRVNTLLMQDKVSRGQSDPALWSPLKTKKKNENFEKKRAMETLIGKLKLFRASNVYL